MEVVIPIIFSLTTFFSTFFGGYLALKKGRDLYLFLGFAGGALIGVSFFDLLPSSIDIAIINAPNISILSHYLLMAAVAGFLYYHVTQRTLAVHSHSKAIHDEPVQTLGKIGASGLVLHSFFDGFGIGIGFQVDFKLGILVALAVIFHDFSDGLNTVTLMLRHGNTTAAARSFLTADALAPIIGVGTSFIIMASPAVLAYILAFFAGEFLSIGASDLIPEAHAKTNSFKIILLTLLGVGMIFVLTRFA